MTPLPSAAVDTDTKAKPTNIGSSDKDSKDTSNTSSVYATALPAVGYVHLEKIQQREQQVIKETQAAAARIGVGVSSSGQDIFDALSKTYVDGTNPALNGCCNASNGFTGHFNLTLLITSTLQAALSVGKGFDRGHGRGYDFASIRA